MKMKKKETHDNIRQKNKKKNAIFGVCVCAEEIRKETNYILCCWKVFDIHAYDVVSTLQ